MVYVTQKIHTMIIRIDLTLSEIDFRSGLQRMSPFAKIINKQYGIQPSVSRRANNSATNE